MRVVAPDVGGGFGVKQFHYGEEAVITWAAGKSSGRSNGWRTARKLSSPTGTAAITSPRPNLRSTRTENSWRCGRRRSPIWAPISRPSAPNIPTNLYGPLLERRLHDAAIYCNVKVVFTNTVPVDAYRGAGRPEATFVVERMVDVAASEMGIDRVELRRRNIIAPEAYPYQTPVLVNTISAIQALASNGALVAADVAGFPARKAPSEGEGNSRPRLFDLCRSLRWQALALYR